MSQLKKSILFSAFVLISMIAVVSATIKYFPVLSPNDYFVLLLYLFLLVFVSSFPLKVGDIYISFILAISISVFLEYGLIVELWLTQAAILISSLVSGQKRSIARITLSQMMVIWVSIFSGLSYLGAGGTIGFQVSEVSYQLVPIIIYTVVYFITNTVLLYFIRRGYGERNTTLFSDAVIWDAATLLLSLPLGVIMYLVKLEYDILGMLFVAIPVIIVTHLFKLYNELHNSHQQLKSLNKISSSFTSELNFDKTISALQQATRELLMFDYAYIFLLNGDRLRLISIEDYNGKVIDPKVLNDMDLGLGEGLSGRVALYRREEIVGTDADLFKLEDEPDYIKYNRSLLSVPMIWHKQVIGVITLGSAFEYHFSKKDLTIAKILASQAAVAIQNATKYQKTEEKTLMDELTGVYNYRAFDEMLRDMIIEADIKEEKLSLLMIDLDHFKQVNDKYGHEAGNVVLKEIANLLKEFTRRDDIVTRYGGEEFTIIFPNTDSNKALTIAERIRSAIESYPINVENSLDGSDAGDSIINVTASIGIATYPEMAETAQDIVRHADRAMYIGSKQAGRNRVSIYQAN